MFQNKTNSMRTLAVSFLLFCSASAFADQNCKLSRDDREQFALAHAWKSVDADLKKTPFSVEWSFGQNTKARFQKQIESQGENRFMRCGLQFESDLVHYKKNVGIKLGIKRYQEIFQKPYKEKPEIYFSIINNMTCPTAADFKVRDEYKKALIRAVDNMSYIVYHRLVALKGEDTRHADDLSIVEELKTQISAIRPEVIRVGADLEFLKRAENLANSLETSLKTKPEVLCQNDHSRAKKVLNAVTQFAIPKSEVVQTK